MLTYTEIDTLVSFLKENKNPINNIDNLLKSGYIQNITCNNKDKITETRSIFLKSLDTNLIYNTATYTFIWCSKLYIIVLGMINIDILDKDKLYFNVIIYNDKPIFISPYNKVNDIINNLRKNIEIRESFFTNPFIKEIEKKYNDTVPLFFRGLPRKSFFWLLNNVELPSDKLNISATLQSVNFACNRLWGFNDASIRANKNYKEIFKGDNKVCNIDILSKLLYIYNNIINFSNIKDFADYYTLNNKEIHCNCVKLFFNYNITKYDAIS